MPEGSQSVQNYIPAAIIALLAAYGLVGSGPGLPPNPSVVTKAPISAARSPSDDANLQAYPHSAAGMLEDFLGTTPIEGENSDRPWLKDGPAATVPPADGPHYTVTFLIVTLPGPASPALRSEFDNDFDAVISAADDSHYALDRFDFPWGEENNTQAESAEPRELDVFKPATTASVSTSGTTAPVPSPSPVYLLKSKKELGPRWETQPGLMLFRPTEDNPQKQRLVMLFLVGETPIRGINKPAMRDALDQISWLYENSRRIPELATVTFQPAAALDIFGQGFAAWGKAICDALGQITPIWPQIIQTPMCELGAAQPAGLYIVGPSFSGSGVSLRNELEFWRAEFPAVSVNFFDGSATGIADSDLNDPDTSNAQCNSDGASDSEHPDCPLHEFAMPDKVRWPLIISDLRNGISREAPLPSPSPISSRTRTPTPSLTPSPSPTPNIALLAEESDYGTDPCKSPDSPCKDGDPFILMPFPLQISDLRTAFGQKSERAPAAPQIGLGDVPETDEDEQKREDVPPDFSARSASYDQLMLDGMMSKIQRDADPYVGIMASDVSDLIFLAGAVRGNSPNSVLFTLSSDLRILRQAVNPDLYGMLVFSSYPLFPGNEQWTPNDPFDGHRLREFPSENAEGIYNATRTAITAAVDGNNAAADPDSQILWTSVVGSDEQLWPLSFQSNDPAFKLDSKALARDCVKFPLIFQFIFLSLCLICIAIGFPFLPQRWRIVTSPDWLERLKDFEDGANRVNRTSPTRLQYTVTLSLGLLTALLIAGAYLGLPLRMGVGIGDVTPAAIILWCLGVVLATAGACCLLRSLCVLSSKLQHWLSLNNWPLALALIPSILAIVFVLVLYTHAPSYLPLVLVRSVTLASGVSPLKVLLLMGIAAFALGLGHLRQSRLREDSALLEQGFLGFDGSSFVSVSKYEKEVIDLLAKAPLELPYAGALITFVVLQTFWYLWRAHWYFYAIDGWPFGLIYIIPATIVYGGLFFLLLRFSAVWTKLHLLLHSLYAHPTRAAYMHMRANRFGDDKGSPIRFLVPAHDLTSVEYCLERTRELLRLAHETPKFWEQMLGQEPDLARKLRAANLPGKIESCEHALARLEPNLSAGKAAAKSDRDLQERMKELSGTLASVFDCVWRSGANQPPNAVVSDSEEHKLVDQAEYFIASRVIDFIRRVYPQMVNLAEFAIAGILALMLASSAYPMPASQVILSLAWGALLFAVVVTLYIFVRMNMDGVLSMLQGTAPGYFTLNSSFIVQLLFVGIIPILAMLGAQFPHSLGAIFSWFGGIFSHPSGG
jgi:hypothetical protein